MSLSYKRKPVPVDGKTQDWPRVVAKDLNSIIRGYMFAVFFVEPATASEVLWLHPCAVNFSIPADWGPRITDGVTEYAGVIPSVDVNPTATFAITVRRKPRGSSVYATIGTWSISTAGLLTATTLDNAQVDIVRGDVLKWVAPASADATAAEMAFTVIGMT